LAVLCLNTLSDGHPSPTIKKFSSQIWEESLNTLSDGHPSPTFILALAENKWFGLNTLSDGHPSPTFFVGVVVLLVIVSKYPL